MDFQISTILYIADDPKVHLALGGASFNGPSWKQRRRNQTIYEKKKGRLQVGSYVYAQVNKGDSFERGYKISRTAVYIVRRVLASTSPVLYQLSGEKM